MFGRPSSYLKSMIVAVTGHRPQHLLEYNSPEDNIKKFYRKVLIKLRPTALISGMALGVDQWAARVALEIGVPLTAALPYPGQAGRWTDEQVTEYKAILDAASEVEILHDNPTSRFESYQFLQQRNEWMVDHSDLLLAVWDGTKGGTGNCVRYARKKGQRIFRIDPSTWESAVLT